MINFKLGLFIDYLGEKMKNNEKTDLEKTKRQVLLPSISWNKHHS